MDGLKETSRDLDDDLDNKPIDVKPNIENLKPKKSKWSDFVEKSRDTSDAGPSETMFFNNTEVVLEVPKKVRNLGKRSNFKCPSISKPSNSQHSKNNVDTNRESSAKIQMDSYNTSLPFNRQLHERNVNTNIINSSESTLIKNESTKNQIDRRALQKFVTTVVNNSKWAQFVETEVESEDHDDYNDSTEAIDDENNDHFTSEDNCTEDLEQYDRYNFCMKNNNSSLFINSDLTKQEFEEKKNKDLGICVVPTLVKRSSKWVPFGESDKYVNKEDICESIENNIVNPVTANTLFALCEDSELDEILDI